MIVYVSDKCHVKEELKFLEDTSHFLHQRQFGRFIHDRIRAVML